MESINRASFIKPCSAAAGRVSTEESEDRAVPKDCVVSCYPQDPSVGPPVRSSLPSEGITAGPDNTFLDTMDNVKQDNEGNLIFKPEQVEFVPVQTFASALKTIQPMEKYLGRRIQWSFGRAQLAIYPDKGVMKNAFYNKKDGSLNFFHFIDKTTGVTVHTGKSFDTVSHETGHAFLDGMKPKLLGWNIETEALHEAVADCVSMLSALQDENNIQMFVSQTDRGFRTRNCISEIGEQFGMTVLGKPCIRSAINGHNYKNPYTLPMFPTGSEDELTGEAHSFCLVFTGAFYDIMEKMYAHNLSKGMNTREALARMRDACGRMLIKGLDVAPPSDATYKDVAKGMLEADRTSEKGEYAAILSQVFEDRWIHTRDEHETPLIETVRNTGSVSPDSPESIMSFIEANRDRLGLPEGAQLKAGPLRRNDDGSCRADVTYTVEVPLKGDEYGTFDGAIIDLEKGVTLSFSNSGALCGLSRSGADRTAVEQTKNTLKRYIGEGRIRLFDPSVKAVKETELFDSRGVPFKGCTVFEGDTLKIVRSPLVFSSRSVQRGDARG
ncbi:MAG: hypothetical protein AB2L14_10050 [Candidatus Xenobiia bacterium LiM19]